VRQTPWGRNYRCPLICTAATAAVAQGLTALALVVGPSPLPEVTPCRSRSSETDACPCFGGSCAGWCDGAHPSSFPREAQGDGAARCWHMMLSARRQGQRAWVESWGH